MHSGFQMSHFIQKMEGLKKNFLFLIAKLLDSTMLTWSQWSSPNLHPEPTANIGYCYKKATKASPSLSGFAKHPSTQPAWADSRSPQGWYAATGSAWCPSLHLPEPAVPSLHTYPQRHDEAQARCRPERWS